MIDKETVFILGAGASADFNFPLGVELRNEIYEKLKSPNTHSEQIAKVFVDFPTDEASDYIPTINTFAKDLYYDGDYSIDAFLERFQKKYLDIGKLAIAQTLAKYEDEAHFFDRDNWYRVLHFKMKQKANVDSYAENKVSFITFNYDRSLEHFFYTALHSFDENIQTSQVIDIIDKIPIIHLYGQLDFLPWQSSDGRAYGAPCTNFQLRSYKKSIGIIFEDVSERINSNFQKAFELCEKAEKIYILGFGWHSKNIDRLRLTELDPLKITGTSWGLGELEISEIKNRFKTTKRLAPAALGERVENIELLNIRIADFMKTIQL
ncbi:MAG: hypothetical protein ABIH85_07330 [Candidatus Omnitrophota bacterium]